jgi:hypothetical protein
MGFRLQITEKLNSNSEEGYKIQIVRCSFFKKIDVKAGREEALTHKVTQQERQRSVAKGKEHYSALYKAMRECWHSVNTRTGAPGSKTPKNVKNSKNCNSISTIRLSMMG